MLRIWGRKNSINVQKVMWAVGELGLSYERIDAGGSFGGLNDPGFVTP
jgi:glutathione S-transferase